ncbi:Hypothetical predicted protein [Xyrichtys novacula]|uniref:Uncharacterized protein n=1 Tax=Xyrichtys novacula TaxID=13765 RepID=A0AAV1GQS3_XYRNO|nr:Hypothetical predicted protein [Xyrichtys novacula]
MLDFPQHNWRALARIRFGGQGAMVLRTSHGIRTLCGHKKKKLTEKMGLMVDLTLAHELQEMPPKQLAQCVTNQGGTEGPERFLDFEGEEDEQWTLSNTNNIFNELEILN